MENKGQNALLVCGLLLVVSAMTPARAWIRYFNTMSWAITLMVLFFSGKYSKTIPQGFLFSAITYFIVRVCLGLLKQTGGLVALSVQFLNAGLLLFVPVVVFLALVAFADYRQFRRFVVAMVLIMLPFLLVTIYEPIGTSRLNIISAVKYDLYDQMLQIEEANAKGVMMYPQIHSLPFLIVSSIMLAKHLRTKRERMVAAIFATILMTTVFRSGFGYAIGVSILLVFLSFVKVKNKEVSFLLVALSCILFLFLHKSGVIVAMLNSVQDGIGEGNAVGAKAKDISDIVQGTVEESSDFSTRITLYKMGLAAFVKYPIFGAPPTVETGGHSYWLDTLGQWGLVGFLVEAVMIAIAFRLERAVLPYFQKTSFDMAAVCFMLLLCLKAGGLSVQHTAFFLMLPSMLIFREDDFYIASNNVRRMFHLPLRIPGPEAFWIRP